MPLENRTHFLKIELEKELLEANYNKGLEIHDLNMVIFLFFSHYHLFYFWNREFQRKEIRKILILKKARL